MANSFSFKKGRFDLRKVKKSDRLLVGAVNSFLAPSKKKKSKSQAKPVRSGPTKTELKKQEAARRRRARENEKARKEAEKRYNEEMIKTGIRSNQYEHRDYWDYELRDKFLKDEDCLALSTIIIGFGDFYENLFEIDKETGFRKKLGGEDETNMIKKGSDYLNKVFDILGPERREVLLEKLNHQYPHAISLPPLIPHKIHLQTENLLIHKDIRENYSKDECENIMKIKCFVASIDKTYLSDGVSKDEHSNLRTSEEELGLNQGYCENYLKTIHKDHQSSINANQKQYLFKTKTFFLPNIVWLIIWMFYVYLGFFGPAPWWTGVIALIGFSAMISNASKDVDDPNFKTVDTNE